MKMKTLAFTTTVNSFVNKPNTLHVAEIICLERKKSFFAECCFQSLHM